MLLAEFRRSLWNGDRAGARRRGLTNPKRCCVGLERLEDRVVLSTSTWNGDTSNLWSVAGNWDTLPTTGSDLIFPSGANNLTNTDDLTSVTSYGSLTLIGRRLYDRRHDWSYVYFDRLLAKLHFEYNFFADRAVQPGNGHR